MHEMSLAQSLLDLAVKHAQGQPIQALRVRVGALSGVVGDSLAFCFDFVSKGTLAEGARLILEPVPVPLRCRACGAATTTARHADLPGYEAVSLALEEGCPICGGKALDVVGGADFQLVEIEVKDG